MSEVQEYAISCPYCNERIELLVEPSTEAQDYIEDCQVCCRPIRLQVAVDFGAGLSVTALTENE